MKLLIKTALVYLAITLGVFIVGITITFNIFEREIVRETDRYLVEKYLAVVKGIRSGEPVSAYIGQKVLVDTLVHPPAAIGRESFYFGDTAVWHRWLKRMEDNRKLVGNAEINGRYFRISTYDVIVESDDIESGVIEALTQLFIILGIVIVISSVLISGFLLKPFHDTLQQIRTFNIKDLKPLKLGKPRTKEFRHLNQFIESMTDKVSRDYRNLKEFSENASHELQTPLAIAKGKLELLLQSEDITEKNIDLIDSAYKAMDHMSKLSQALTLLTKIENLEYSDVQTINLSALLKNALEDFREIFQLKRIRLAHDIEDGVEICNDIALIRVMVNNLINNAIRHNTNPGEIFVQLTGAVLLISNTGKEPTGSPEAMFDRFKTGRNSSHSMGLGLTIVKKICDISQYTIQYTFAMPRHIIEVRFT